MDELLNKNFKLITLVAAIAETLTFIFSFPKIAVIIISCYILIGCYIKRESIYLYTKSYLIDFSQKIALIPTNLKIAVIGIFIIPISILAMLTLLNKSDFSELDANVERILKNKTDYELLNAMDKLAEEIWIATIAGNKQKAANGLLRLAFWEYLLNPSDESNAVNSMLIAKTLHSNLDIPNRLKDDKIYKIFKDSWSDVKSSVSKGDSAIIVLAKKREYLADIIRYLEFEKIEIDYSFNIKNKVFIYPLLFPKGKYAEFFADIFAQITHANFVIGVDSDEQLRVLSTFLNRRRWLGCHLPQISVALNNSAKAFYDMRKFIYSEENHQKAFESFYNGQIGQASLLLKNSIQADTTYNQSTTQQLFLLAICNLLLQDYESYHNNIYKLSSSNMIQVQSHLRVLLELLSTVTFQIRNFQESTNDQLWDYWDRRIRALETLSKKYETRLVVFGYDLFKSLSRIKLPRKSTSAFPITLDKPFPFAEESNKPKFDIKDKNIDYANLKKILSSDLALERPDLTLLPRVYLLGKISDPIWARQLLDSILKDFKDNRCVYLRGSALQALFPLAIEKFKHLYPDQVWEEIFEFAVEQGIDVLTNDSPHANLAYTFGIYTSVLSISQQMVDPVTVQKRINNSIQGKLPGFSDAMGLFFHLLGAILRDPSSVNSTLDKFIDFLRYYSNRSIQDNKDHQQSAWFQLFVNLKALYERNRSLVLESNQHALKHIQQATIPDSVALPFLCLKNFMEIEAAYYYKDTDHDLYRAYWEASQNTSMEIFSKLLEIEDAKNIKNKNKLQEIKKIAQFLGEGIFTCLDYLNGKTNSYQMALTLIKSLGNNKLWIPDLNLKESTNEIVTLSYLLMADAIIMGGINEGVVQKDDRILQYLGDLLNTLSGNLRNNGNEIHYQILKLLEIFQKEIWTISNAIIKEEELDKETAQRLLKQSLAVLEAIERSASRQTNYKDKLILGTNDNRELFYSAILWQLRELISYLKRLSLAKIDLEDFNKIVSKNLIPIIIRQTEFVDRHYDKTTQAFLRLEKSLALFSINEHKKAIKEFVDAMKIADYEASSLAKLTWHTLLGRLLFENDDYFHADSLFQENVGTVKDDEQIASFFYPLIVASKIGQKKYDEAFTYLDRTIQYHLGGGIFVEPQFFINFKVPINYDMLAAVGLGANTLIEENSNLVSNFIFLYSKGINDTIINKFEINYQYNFETNFSYDIIFCSLLAKSFIYLVKNNKLSATNELEKALWYASSSNMEFTDIDLSYLRFTAIYAALKGLTKLSSDALSLLENKQMSVKSKTEKNANASKLPALFRLIEGTEKLETHCDYLYSLAKGTSFFNIQEIFNNKPLLDESLISETDWNNFIASNLLAKLDFEYTPK